MTEPTLPAGADRPIVFDASAIIALFEDEAGADVVEELCLNNPGRLYIHAVNVCEVLYHSRRAHGEHGMAQALTNIQGIGLTISEDLGAFLRDDVATLKADLTRVALGDCFLLALARQLGGEAVSSDRKELGPLQGRNICPIRLIR